MQPSSFMPPVSRRMFLRGGASAAAGAILAACGQQTGSEPAIPSPAPTRIVPLPTLVPTPTSVPANQVALMSTIAHDFDHPTALTLDPEGNLYVVDALHSRIQKFDHDGQFVLMWGSQGITDGSFVFTTLAGIPPGGGIAVHPDGSIYVGDLTGRIQRFDRLGKFLERFGGTGVGSAPAPRAAGLTIDTQGKVYVADAQSNCIHIFDPSGQEIQVWRHEGVGNGQFLSPAGLALDASARLHFIDQGNSRVQVFDPSGGFVHGWGMPGRGPGTFDAPRGIALDARGDVYVTDRIRDRVQRFTSDGQFLMEWGGQGDADGLFTAPSGIVVDARRSVYVADDRRVQKFQVG